MNKKFTRKVIKILRAWAFYDWANSVYPLVIGTAVFPISTVNFLLSDYIDFLGINYKNTALIQHITLGFSSFGFSNTHSFKNSRFQVIKKIL